MTELNNKLDLLKAQIEGMEKQRETLILNTNEQDAAICSAMTATDETEKIIFEEKKRELKAEEHKLWHELIDMGNVLQNNLTEIKNSLRKDECWEDKMDERNPGMVDRYYEIYELMENVWNAILIQMWENKQKKEE